MGWLPWQLDQTAWPASVPEFGRINGAETAQNAPPDIESAVRVDRHNSPDLVTQIEQAQTTSIDAVICSALDDEPRLRLNAAVLARRPDDVLKGMREVMKRSRATRGCIVIESDAPPHWQRPLRSLLKGDEIEIVELPNHYPQADPIMLLFALLDRRLRPGQSPVEAGVVLLDAAAAATLAAPAFLPVGVLRHRTQTASYFDIPPGTPLQSVLKAAGDDLRCPIFAGDWRRQRQASSGFLIGGGELTFHAGIPGDLPNPQPCVRCGWCMDVCPTGVSPALVLEAAQRNDKPMALRGGRAACIECGLCDLVCPANLPLLQGIRHC